jgi:hypothetical protein
MGGLTRYFVLFAMRLKTRRVEIAGITSQPTEAWMKQVARNWTEGFLRYVRYLIVDRDPLYTSALRGMLLEVSVKTLRRPARSPNLNAYAERFVLSIKSEGLGRLVVLGRGTSARRSPSTSNTTIASVPTRASVTSSSRRRPRSRLRRSGKVPQAARRHAQLLLPGGRVKPAAMRAGRVGRVLAQGRIFHM